MDAPDGSVCFSAGLSGIGRDAPEGHFEERPPHAARLGGFAMDRTEVTVDAYGGCVAAGRCPPPGCAQQTGYQQPVTCVAWTDAMTYCAWRHGRLPTEAEWERAAGGVLPTHRTHPWGDTDHGPEAEADLTPEGVQRLGAGVAEWVSDPGGFYPAVPDAGGMDAGAMAEVPEEGGRDGRDAAVQTPTVSRAPTVATVERAENGWVVEDNPHGLAGSPWRVVRGGDDALPMAARTTTLRRFRQPGDRLPWVGLRCAY